MASAVQVIELQKENKKPPVINEVPELEDLQKLRIKSEARSFMHKSTVSNARAAISKIQGYDDHEEAKLFVRSLKPRY